MKVRIPTLLFATASLAGCFTFVPPDPPPDWTSLLMKEVPRLGDDCLGSSLVKNATEKDPLLLTIGRMSDSSLESVDARMLLKKMKNYLKDKAGRRIMVFDMSEEVETARRKRAKIRMHSRFKGSVAKLAPDIIKKYRRYNVKIAVNPVVNGGNVENVCADGFISLLRDEIVSRGMGNITFIDPSKSADADYILGGEFSKQELSASGSPSGEDSRYEQRLRVTITDAKTGVVNFEVAVIATEQDFAPSSHPELAIYILNGSLSEVSKDLYYATDRCVLMEFKLVDLDTTKEEWNKSVDIHKKTNKPIEYH